MLLLGGQVLVHPTDMAARTVDQVNADAPDYTVPTVSTHQHLAVQQEVLSVHCQRHHSQKSLQPLAADL